MEALGPPGTGAEPRLSRSPIWGIVIEAIEARLGTVRPDPGGLRWALSNLAREALYLPPSMRLEDPWKALEQLASQVSTSGELFAALGLPCRADGRTQADSLGESLGTVEDLTRLLDTDGIEDGFQQLVATPTGMTVAMELNALKEVVTLAEAVGVDLLSVPTQVYRSNRPLPGWVTTIDRETLAAILSESGRGSRKGRVHLTVTNAVNAGAQLEGEPLVVQDTVDLLVEDPTNAVLSGVQVVRGTGHAAALLPAGSSAGGPLTDGGVPFHRRRQRYVAEATNRERSRPIYVLSLSKFECHGTARIEAATKNEPPKYDPKTGTWRQRITLPLSGVHETRGPSRSGVAGPRRELAQRRSHEHPR